jgi:hypothetical protein
MSAEIFAEWLRRQGHHVVRTESSYWYDQGPRVYQAFPYHWLIEPSRQELQDFLSKTKAIGLRYSAPLSSPVGKLSYHVVCTDPMLDVTSLQRQVCQNIKKGIKYAGIERIPISRLSAEGWHLRFETLTRQGRQKAENQAWWQRLCHSAEDLPGFEAWGGVHDGQLVSAILAFECDDCYTFLYHQSATDHLRYGINNAIFYLAAKEAFAREGITQVFLGLQSLDAPPDVDEFKFRMSFCPRPVRQRVVFHPWIAPLFNQGSYSALKYIASRNPSNPSLAKAVGMLNFYLQGRLPLSEQPCPESLVEQLSTDDENVEASEVPIR